MIRALGTTLLGVAFLLAGCEEEPLEVAEKRMGPIPGKPIEEHRAVVTAVPEIQSKGDYSLLLLPAIKGRPIEVICGVEFSPWYATLPRGKKVTFTVWQTKEVSRHTRAGKEDFTWSSEIETIRDGDTVLYDAALCPLHHTRMVRADIEISYGLPMREFLDAMEQFHGGPGFTLGGCVVSDISPRSERGYQCAECVTAYERWEKKWEEQVAERKKAEAALPVDKGS
jgi:hypothetical protein